MIIPSKSLDLIRVLDELYPDRMLIDERISDTQKVRLEGKVELIRLLKANLDSISGEEKWE